MMKVFRKIKEWIVWLLSADVREAINRGASYEEVEQIVAKEMER